MLPRGYQALAGASLCRRFFLIASAQEGKDFYVLVEHRSTRTPGHHVFIHYHGLLVRDGDELVGEVVGGDRPSPLTIQEVSPDKEIWGAMAFHPSEGGERLTFLLSPTSDQEASGSSFVWAQARKTA